MNWKRRHCSRFQQLCEEQSDRVLTNTEAHFVQSHRHRCQDCAHQEKLIGISLLRLREAVIDDPSDRAFQESFDTRLVRMLHISRARDRISYWFPAILGGAIAAMAVMAMLQSLSGSPSLRSVLHPAGEATRYQQHDWSGPKLEINPLLR